MRTVLFLILVFFLTTCTKFGENIHVKGKVINPTTGVGIANVKIELQKKTTFEFATGFKAVETVYTDNNGEFEIRHLGGLKQYYIRCQYTQDYYPIGWYVDSEKQTSDFIRIKKGKTFYAEYQMLPYGYYQLKLKNANCYDEFDEFEFRMYPYFDENYYGISLKQIMGCYENIFIESKIPACEWKVIWSVKRNGQNESHNETFNISENEHKILEIIY